MIQPRWCGRESENGNEKSETWFAMYFTYRHKFYRSEGSRISSAVERHLLMAGTYLWGLDSEKEIDSRDLVPTARHGENPIFPSPSLKSECFHGFFPHR